MSLEELRKFITLNGHLPEVPPAAVVEAGGLELGEMNKVLLKKIEELTLHLLEKDLEIKKLTNQHNSRENDMLRLISTLDRRLKSLENENK